VRRAENIPAARAQDFRSRPHMLAHILWAAVGQDILDVDATLENQFDQIASLIWQEIEKSNPALPSPP